MNVSDIMITQVGFVRTDALASSAYRVMRKRKFRHLPVLNERNEVVGFVSDRDLRNLAVLFENEETGREEFFMTNDVPVEQIMAKNPVCVAPDADVRQVVRLLLENKFGAIIVAENKRLAGIVSYVDLLGLLDRLLGEQGEKQAVVEPIAEPATEPDSEPVTEPV